MRVMRGRRSEFSGRDVRVDTPAVWDFGNNWDDPGEFAGLPRSGWRLTNMVPTAEANSPAAVNA